MNAYCIECGTPISRTRRNCEHVHTRAPGYCTHFNGHEQCPGHAARQPPGTCPCSCHDRIDLPEAIRDEYVKRLQTIEHELGGEPCNDAPR